MGVTTRARTPCPPAEALQDGQHEGGRLAGAGLGAADDVAAGDDLGNGLLLDGRRLLVAEPLDCVEHGVVEAEVGKCVCGRESYWFSECHRVVRSPSEAGVAGGAAGVQHGAKAMARLGGAASLDARRAARERGYAKRSCDG